MQFSYLKAQHLKKAKIGIPENPWNKLVNKQTVKLKIAKNALVLKCLMASSADIFDLNLKSPMLLKRNDFGYSSENIIRFSQNWV